MMLIYITVYNVDRKIYIICTNLLARNNIYLKHAYLMVVHVIPVIFMDLCKIAWKFRVWNGKDFEILVLSSVMSCESLTYEVIMIFVQNYGK